MILSKSKEIKDKIKSFDLSAAQKECQNSKAYHEYCSKMLCQSGMFSTQDYLSKHRHDSPEAQQKYDNLFGLVLRK